MAVASNKPAGQPAAVRRAPIERAAEVPEFDQELELLAYRKMLLIRRFEEKAGQLYGMGLIGGFCHLYIGQEAVVVGMQMTIKDGDEVITGYRDHGHMLACGMDPKGVMAELTGRRGGYSKGKGGSMHMFSVEKGFFGGHGIVGAQVPIGTGLAFANRYRGNDNVSLTYLGDGAANQGQVYESFNMAKLWKLPVVYIIENNRYGMGTALERASAIHDIYERGASYNMSRAVCDGQDVFEVRAAVQKAIDRARAESTPTLLEVRTYRFMGHSMSDAVSGTYRTKAELEEHMKRDPIVLLRTHMMEHGELNDDELHKMDDEIKAVVQDAWDFADKSPEPPLEALYEDVYVDTTSDAAADAVA
jgi:pyruvate dehydrogenase E1 component alpha subunit